jgi:hypothetical protein
MLSTLSRQCSLLFSPGRDKPLRKKAVLEVELIDVIGGEDCWRAE